MGVEGSFNMGVDVNFFSRIIKQIEQSGVLPDDIGVFLPTLITIALNNNSERTLKVVFDHLEVPCCTANNALLSLKERITLYQLGKHTP